ncbi:MAG: hypothetical protein AAF563_01370 [Pseudomonadota bacterium]
MPKFVCVLLTALVVLSATPALAAYEPRTLDEIDKDLDSLIEAIGTGKTDYGAELAGLMSEVYTACSQFRDNTEPPPEGTCGSRLNADCVGARVSMLIDAMRRAETADDMVTIAQVLANLPPGWVSDDLAGDQAYLYGLITSDDRLDDNTRSIVDRALMNSRGLFYDAFYARGRTEGYMDDKIGITDLVISAYPDSRFLLYAEFLKARAFQEQSMIGYFTADGQGVPSWPLSEAAQRALMQSNEVYQTIYERIDTTDDDRLPNFRSDILMLMAINDILLDDMDAARSNLKDVIEANQEPAPLDQVFVNKFLPVYFCDPREEIEPAYYVQVDQYFNPVQLADYMLDLMACRNDTNLGDFLLALNRFENADYRVFLASFQKEEQAEAYLEHMRKAAAEPGNKGRLDAILDIAREPLCAAQPAAEHDNQAGITEPSDNGWVGVYYGGNLTHEQGLEIIRLLRDINPQRYRDAYLWRPQVN